MNWLAHLILSEPSPAFRIGNLLPDILSRPEMEMLPAKFQRGIACHREIDRFTDSHPIFWRSRRRLEAPFRRFGGILIDIFYDHFLACAWHRYSSVPLGEFVAEVHASFPAHRADLPLSAYTRLLQIQSGGWLSCYQELGGVRRALQGIGSRLRQPQALGVGVAELERHYTPLQEDFTEFFPELTRHVAARKHPAA